MHGKEITIWPKIVGNINCLQNVNISDPFAPRGTLQIGLKLIRQSTVYLSLLLVKNLGLIAKPTLNVFFYFFGANKKVESQYLLSIMEEWLTSVKIRP